MIKFKILFAFIFIYANSLFASFEQIDTLQNNEIALITSINNFIEDRAIKPTTITQLKNANYLPADFEDSNILTTTKITYSYGTNDTIIVNTHLNSTAIAITDRDRYLVSLNNRDYNRQSSTSSNMLISTYTLSAAALNNISAKAQRTYANYVGKAEPTTYTTVTTGQVWLDGNFEEYKIKIYDGSLWNTLNISNKNISSSGTLSNQDAIPLLKRYWDLTEVNISLFEKDIMCSDAGTNYNPAKDRCEAYTSDACGSDNYDLGVNQCWKYEYKNKITTTNYSDSILSLYIKSDDKFRNQITGYSGAVTSDGITLPKGIRGWWKMPKGWSIEYTNDISNIYDSNGNLALANWYNNGRSNASFKIENGALYIKSDDKFRNQITGYSGAVTSDGITLPKGIRGWWKMPKGWSIEYTNDISNIYDSNGNLALANWYNNGRSNASFKIENGALYIKSDDKFRNQITGYSGAVTSDGITLPKGIRGWWKMPKGWSIEYTNDISNIYDSNGNLALANWYNNGRSNASFKIESSCSTGNLIDGKCQDITKTCPSGGYSEYGSSTQCRRKGYYSPSCSGKKMTVSPFYDTLHYGNNGLCYSDAGLYCKQTGLSWDGIYTCFNTNLTCNDSSLKMDLAKDKCEKYIFSCGAGKNRYGLAEHQTDNDATVLFNRITDPHTKLNSISSLIIAGDVDVNDSNGAMCVENKTSTFSQGSTAGIYTIDGDSKSGF